MVEEQESPRRFIDPGQLRVDYAGELNEQQYAAATALPGPSLVIAGAGSGKTRTLVYRVAFLLEQGIPPHRILLLTFTNKAAREMMDRVGQVLGGQVAGLWGGTFHSIGNRILRREGFRLGLTSGFKILDRDDSEVLMKACLDSLFAKPDRAELPKADMILGMLSFSTNVLCPLREFIGDRHREWVEAIDEIELVVQEYEKRKLDQDLVDFDDLLYQWWRLMRNDPEVREQCQRRFHYILVDEYQDTNPLQSALVDILAERHGNVMAVGDDAQSIYSWRGADFQNMLAFPERYPKAVMHRIEINYRSTPQILEVANAVIGQNQRQFEKHLVSQQEDGPLPKVVHLESTREQASFVGREIQAALEEGIPPNEIAVLYRSHFHAVELQMELTRRRTPFLITSGIRFFEQAHLKDVICWLKLLQRPKDEIAFRRLVRHLPGVGDRSADKLWQAFCEGLAGLQKGDGALSGGKLERARQQPLASVLQMIQSSVPAKAREEWQDWVLTVGKTEKAAGEAKPGEIVSKIVSEWYEKVAHRIFPNYEVRLDELEQFVEFGNEYESLADLLSEVALLSELETPERRRSNEPMVRLMTVHQAKGLEFEVVFVITLAEGCFPNHRALAEGMENLEEERRLFYVAITRAKRALILSYPKWRAGAYEPKMYAASRFLSEVPSELCQPAGYTGWGWNAGGAAADEFEPF